MLDDTDDDIDEVVETDIHDELLVHVVLTDIGIFDDEVEHELDETDTNQVDVELDDNDECELLLALPEHLSNMLDDDDEVDVLEVEFDNIDDDVDEIIDFHDECEALVEVDDDELLNAEEVIERDDCSYYVIQQAVDMKLNDELRLLYEIILYIHSVATEHLV